MNTVNVQGPRTDRSSIGTGDGRFGRRAVLAALAVACTIFVPRSAAAALQWMRTVSNGTSIAGGFYLDNTTNCSGHSCLHQWNSSSHSWNTSPMTGAPGGGIFVTVDENSNPWLVDNRNQIWGLLLGTWTQYTSGKPAFTRIAVELGPKQEAWGLWGIDSSNKIWTLTDKNVWEDFCVLGIGTISCWVANSIAFFPQAVECSSQSHATLWDVESDGKAYYQKHNNDPCDASDYTFGQGGVATTGQAISWGAALGATNLTAWDPVNNVFVYVIGLPASTTVGIGSTLSGIKVAGGVPTVTSDSVFALDSSGVVWYLSPT